MLPFSLQEQREALLFIIFLQHKIFFKKSVIFPHCILKRYSISTENRILCEIQAEISIIDSNLSKYVADIFSFLIHCFSWFQVLGSIFSCGVR